MDVTGELVFLKLGGSLITDKARPFTARLEVLRRLANEVSEALKLSPNIRLLIGHGSGSFGHQVAAQYGTHRGVASEREWRGFSEVSAAAARLNRLVSDIFLAAGVPTLTLQPSASAKCRAGELISIESGPIQESLARGLVPLLYGDVALDEEWGGTIVSTEMLFEFLAAVLDPHRILLVGADEGVKDGEGSVVPQLTPRSLPSLLPSLAGSEATDVTGGMLDKVERMCNLVATRSDLVVHIITGNKVGLVQQALGDPSFSGGTRILST
jgi:isopentenyl phosphate kinase